VITLCVIFNCSYLASVSDFFSADAVYRGNYHVRFVQKLPRTTGKAEHGRPLNMGVVYVFDKLGEKLESNVKMTYTFYVEFTK
jgi:hypothetical protein